jgi:hypothetical protein
MGQYETKRMAEARALEGRIAKNMKPALKRLHPY